eukprot:TRINITY_DN13709_c0_g1::TRINITY_DN13709_c0_g1_i1::g.16804::m.16804 TRINITY_DN13709_c0_g1::TRINITY_DN13709_c0_g1_i1::g.16804  ORF type:complete len:128 (-),score=0.04,sp/Q6LX65/LADH_METMP/33.61/1e-17,Aldedh/PF00171.17/5.9e-18,Aldedh/PF00171.17/14 TRINITY_DN13709_c0_g1_i1:102-485(-)
MKSANYRPVVLVERFTDFENVIRLCNESKYGLQAGVFTNNLQHAFYAFEHLDVGGVVLNDVPAVRVDSQPYGGVKVRSMFILMFMIFGPSTHGYAQESGNTREGIRYAIESMTELKILLMKDVGAKV